MNRVVVVGSNPAIASPDSTLPFAGTRSGKTLRSWLDRLGLGPVFLVNVSSVRTPGNRKLKVSEYELEALRKVVRDDTTTVIALGETAAHALEKIGVEHFKLPHPSGRNRLLNDMDYLDQKIAECRAFIAKKDRESRENGWISPIVKSRAI